MIIKYYIFIGLILSAKAAISAKAAKAAKAAKRALIKDRDLYFIHIPKNAGTYFSKKFLNEKKSPSHINGFFLSNKCRKKTITANKDSIIYIIRLIKE